MPPAVFSILMALVEYGGSASRAEIEAASGYGANYTSQLMWGLRNRGWTWSVKGRRGSAISITELGKIALAIEVGRRSKMIAQGRRVTMPGTKTFFSPVRRLALWR
jgi:hypothetical protein